jgi:hypothetical protein
MAGLKSFFPLLSPFVSVTPLALYERQRALVNLGVIKSAGGRGPGSGVPLTAENVAAILISLLASDSLSEVDQRVVDLCNARPEIPDEKWIKLGNPTFLTEAGRLLTGEDVLWRPDRKQKALAKRPHSPFGILTRKEWNALKRQWEALKLRVSRSWRGEIVFDRYAIEYRPSGISEPINSIEVSAETPECLISNLVTMIKAGSHMRQTEEDDE